MYLKYKLLTPLKTAPTPLYQGCPCIPIYTCFRSRSDMFSLETRPIHPICVYP